ncbi:alpha/beta hydrolase fold domain-containing protein [Nonomuraea insulae]|uniref:Alpha/beta hydrolase fold domain-containing protein n=1 Tax=Nonomuraea insulae TaxID=1616787 RepID=A0ABW1CFX3_9ACTN
MATACLGDLVAPAQADGYITYSDVAYASGGSQQVLDLYVPKGVRRVPVIVYIHGGGWSAGDKSELQRIPEWTSLLAQGFAVASVNYTLSTSATFPRQIHEVKAAIRYLRATGFRYGLNGQVGVWGGSAGGQLAALAGTSCGVPALEGTVGLRGPSSCVQAVADLSGPTDLSALADDPLLAGAVAAYLGCPDGIPSCPPALLRQASPITHLASGRRPPPFLIGHGDADTVVPIEQSRLLFSALTQACGSAGFFTLHGQDHFFPFGGGLSEPFPARTVQTSKRCGEPVTSTEPPLSFGTLGSFFREHLRAPQRGRPA